MSAARDSFWMRRALLLALQGEGRVEPNPMVGCVLVSYDGDASTGPAGEEAQGELLGEGFHTGFGKPHAEREALADAHRNGYSERLKGCTAYVTLEPCCHYGKTPPCTDALIEAKIGRVVVSQLDPFDQVRGQGVERLRSAGLQVEIGVEQDAAAELNAPYLKRLNHGRPWVIAKWAMSLDGKLATRTGDSQWISGEASREEVQALRGRVDAILVGSRTALCDDPRLISRAPQPLRSALRVVADSTLQLPLASRLVSSTTEAPVLLFAGPHASEVRARELRAAGCQVHVSNHEDPSHRLDELLQMLAREFSVTNVLVEGGGELLGSLLELRQIDQCEVFLAPKLLGGREAVSPIAGLGLTRLSESPVCQSLRYQQRGEDMHLSCRLRWQC